MRACGRNMIVGLAALLAIALSPAGASAAQTTGGVASASGVEYEPAAKAFDGSTGVTNGWYGGNNLPVWLQYEFDTPKVVTNYSIFCVSGQAGGFTSTHMPKVWKLQGQAAGSETWDDLDTQSDGLLQIDTWKSFPVASTGVYKKYRINITGNVGQTTVWTFITELELDYPALPVISNSAPLSVTASSAALVGNLVSTGDAPTTVYCFWGTNNGGTVKANWATNASLGLRDPGLVTNSVSGLAGLTRYYYTFYASNATFYAWATPSESFTTLSAPAVDNGGGAVNMGPSSLLRGTVTAGDPMPTAYIYWDTSTHGTNKNDWPSGNAIVIGPTNGAFSASIGVSPGQAYYYICYASNSVGESWAPETTNFTASPAGVVKTWAGTGNWNEGANWTPSGVPEANDSIVIESGTVTLSNAVYVRPLEVRSGATLAFTNWATKLTASNVTVLSGGNVTCSGPFTNSPAMSNRVWIVCTNFSLDSGASINVEAKGYAAITDGASATGSGPGGGQGLAGGGYGGRGGDYSSYRGGLPYGSPEAPESPGSAGGNNDITYYFGGHGGGAVRIEAPGGLVTVNGKINANGQSTPQNDYATCNGSGGGIYITCRTFAGTNGTITANAGNITDGRRYVSGGGGRIAVVYDTSAQAAMPKPSVLFSAAKGCGIGMTTGHDYANFERDMTTFQDMGTIYFPDGALLDGNWLPHTGLVWMASAAWNVHSLTVSNGWIRFPAPGFQITVTNAATITGASGKLELGGANVYTQMNVGPYDYIYSDLTAPTFTVGGNLVLTNGGSLTVFAGRTNGASTNYGALVTVAGDVLVANSSWVYLHSNPTNGGSALLRMNNLTVAGPGGGISADYRGCRKSTYEYATHHYGYGTGGGAQNYGGSYGGLGWNGDGGATPIYGSSNAPIDPGSAGGTYALDNSIGGNGGGAIRIEAAKTVTIKGALSANGQKTLRYYGGGSGGGIYIRCKTFDGTAGGSLSANGGRAESIRCGGGGRIAVWRVNDLSGGAVSASVSGGSEGMIDASPGTIVWGLLPQAGTVIKFR